MRAPPHKPVPLASRPFSYGLPRAAVIRLLSGNFTREDYSLYLRTDWWKIVRGQAFDHYGRACMMCGTSIGSIQVHHRGRDAYSHLFRERVTDHVTVVCRRCHKRHHGR